MSPITAFLALALALSPSVVALPHGIPSSEATQSQIPSLVPRLNPPAFAEGNCGNPEWYNYAYNSFETCKAIGGSRRGATFRGWQESRTRLCHASDSTPEDPSQGLCIWYEPPKPQKKKNASAPQPAPGHAGAGGGRLRPSFYRVNQPYSGPGA